MKTSLYQRQCNAAEQPCGLLYYNSQSFTPVSMYFYVLSIFITLLLQNKIIRFDELVVLARMLDRRSIM